MVGLDTESSANLSTGKNASERRSIEYMDFFRTTIRPQSDEAERAPWSRSVVVDGFNLYNETSDHGRGRLSKNASHNPHRYTSSK